jgi:hypothetical protein
VSKAYLAYEIYEKLSAMDLLLSLIEVLWYYLLHPFLNALAWLVKAVHGAIRWVSNALGMSFLGEPTIFASRSRTCDLEFVQRGDSWSATITTRPRKLKFINTQGLHPRCSAQIKRARMGQLESPHFLSNSSSPISVQAPILISFPEVPDAYISTDPADWNVDVWAGVEDDEPRVSLYFGHPTSIKASSDR